jgi:hypothetical protein
MWVFWWTNWHWGRSSPIISVSLANSHSTDCSTVIVIYHPELVQLAKLWPTVPSKLKLTPPEKKKPRKKQVEKLTSARLHGIT